MEQNKMYVIIKEHLHDAEETSNICICSTEDKAKQISKEVMEQAEIEYQEEQSELNQEQQESPWNVYYEELIVY